MKKKAVVMAVDHGRAVVLVDGGQFLEITDRFYRVGQQIEVDVSSRGKRHPLRRAALLAACVTLMVATSGMAVTKYVPWTYVSMDSDVYSVQFTLNARGEVLDARDLQTGGVMPFTRFERAADAEKRVFASSDADATVLVGVADRFGRTSPAAGEIREAGEGSSLEIREVTWQNADRARDADTTLGRFDYVWDSFAPADLAEAETYYRLPFGDLTNGPDGEPTLPGESSGGSEDASREDAPSSAETRQEPLRDSSLPQPDEQAVPAPAQADIPGSGTDFGAPFSPQTDSYAHTPPDAPQADVPGAQPGVPAVQENPPAPGGAPEPWNQPGPPSPGGCDHPQKNPGTFAGNGCSWV